MVYLTNHKVAFLQSSGVCIVDIDVDRADKTEVIHIERKLPGWEENAIGLMNLTPLG